MALESTPDEDFSFPVPYWFLGICFLKWILQIPRLLFIYLGWKLQILRKNSSSTNPIAIGHRGARKEGILENSPSAFQFAFDSGAQGIELDTQATLDGLMVILHDSTWDRTTTAQGKVSTTPSYLLDSIRLRNGEKVPTLEETVQKWADQLLLNIEIKKEETVEKTKLSAQKIAAILKNLSVNPKQIVLSSFSPLALYYIRKEYPQGIRAQLIGKNYIHPSHSQFKNWLLGTWFFAIALQTQGMVWDKEIPLEKPETVSLAKALGFFLWVYTANSKEEWSQLTQMGIDGIITDFPDGLVQFLKNH